MKLEIPCWAKINESLLVGLRDERGYHPLKTVFQAISLSDILTVSTETECDSFTCSEAIPADNTVIRAWTLARELVKVPPLQVHLTKTIPTQSGLGGGSSDAAGLLRAIYRVTGRKLRYEELLEIALAVGADVPFFLGGGRALGEHYGEKLKWLPDLAKRWLVLAHPDASCPTPTMYAKLDAIERPVTLEGREGNDFELVAPKECLELIGQMRALGSLQCGLTGSGSTVFGYFPSLDHASRAKQELKPSRKTLAHTVERENGFWLPL